MTKYLAVTVFFLLAANAAAAAELRATVDWARTAQLAPAVSGLVAKVHVAVGQRVKKGVAVVSLDSRLARAELAVAQADLARSTPALAEAERELERAEDLLDRTLISDRDLELVRIETSKARALHAKAKAELTIARLHLEFNTVRAPFAGLVLAVKAAAGEYLASGLAAQPVVVLADDSSLLARADVDAQVLAGLKLDGAAQVLIGGQSVSGTVAAIGYAPSTVEAGVPRYRLAVAFAPGDNTLRAGQAVTIRLP